MKEMKVMSEEKARSFGGRNAGIHRMASYYNGDRLMARHIDGHFVPAF